jgi:hypothetical protein
MKEILFIKVETNSLAYDRQGWKITWKLLDHKPEEKIIQTLKFNSSTLKYIENYYNDSIDNIYNSLETLTELPKAKIIVSMNKDFNSLTIANTFRLKPLPKLHIDLNSLFLNHISENIEGLEYLSANMMFEALNLSVANDKEYVEAMEKIFKICN